MRRSPATMISRAVGALADLFKGYVTTGFTMSDALAKRLEELLRTQENMARALEREFEVIRLGYVAAQAQIAAGAQTLDVERQTAVLEGVREGKVVDLSGVFRREQTVIGRGYLGDLGDAS